VDGSVDIDRRPVDMFGPTLKQSRLTRVFLNRKEYEKFTLFYRPLQMTIYLSLYVLASYYLIR
jgi:hypothetical protein